MSAYFDGYGRMELTVWRVTDGIWRVLRSSGDGDEGKYSLDEESCGESSHLDDYDLDGEIDLASRCERIARGGSN